MIVQDNTSHNRRTVFFRLAAITLALLMMLALCPPEIFAAPPPQSDPFGIAMPPEFLKVANALKRNDYDEALKQLSEMRSVAVKTKNRLLLQEILAVIKDVNQLKRAFATVREKIGALKENPNDPEANEKVGIFYCAEKGDWSTGLQLLSKSRNSDLRQTSNFPGEWTRGNYPRSFSFDPTGQFLYCCNQRADSAAVFKVDKNTGKLNFTNHYAAVGNPSHIVFLDLAK